VYVCRDSGVEVKQHLVALTECSELRELDLGNIRGAEVGQRVLLRV
jgi:hypothetical protein